MSATGEELIEQLWKYRQELGRCESDLIDALLATEAAQKIQLEAQRAYNRKVGQMILFIDTLHGDPEWTDLTLEQLIRENEPSTSEVEARRMG